MMKITLKSIKHCLRMKLFLADVNQRICSLLRASILGAVSAFFIYYVLGELGNKTLQNSITILFLGLPTSYVLWRFRTYDVQRQIDKTEENTNNSTFFECERILTEEKPPEHDSLSKKTALEQLAYLKRETGFDKKRIDSLTRGLDLGGKNFNLARFSGLDLSMANLNQTILFNANLTDAILSDANLSEADLSGADLTKAYLSGADLTRADLSKTDLAGANLSGAKLANANLTGSIYDDETKFSGTILKSKEMRDRAGMEYRPDEPAKKSSS